MRARTSRIAVGCLWVITLGLCISAVALRTASLPAGELSAYEVLPFVPGVMAFSTAGGLVAWRRPRMAAGWLLMVVGLTWTVMGVLYAYIGHAMVSGPQSLPGVGIAAWVSNWIWILAFMALGCSFCSSPMDACQDRAGESSSGRQP